MGRNKFIYDVWGDTINIARALKTTCPPGAILISENVYNRLGDLYEFKLTDAIVENGKGPLKAWQLTVYPAVYAGM